jgi:protein-tyrosine phosphatase
VREIVPGQLWIGNAFDIRPFVAFQSVDVGAVVDLAIDEPSAQLGRDLIYVRIPLNDSADNSTTLLRCAIETVARLMNAKIATLVCCSAGMSRSPAIACGALALQEHESPNEILRTKFVEVPHDISPGLWRSVVEAVVAGK